MVRVVPELCDQEDLAAWDTRLLDGSTYGWLGTVDTRSVDVSVSGIEGVSDSLFLGVLVLPGTEANGRNASSTGYQLPDLA